MYIWYLNAKAVIKHMGNLSAPINIEKGTRQGGLTSPFLFNLIYQDMMQELSESTGGLSIGNSSYNVFCYADDILLMSMTITGLQKIMACANRYIAAHGLSFNAAKSSCVVFGKHHFVSEPRWTLNGASVDNKDEVEYLGAILSNTSKRHCDNRVSRCRRAFYSLQSAGMCEHGVEPRVKSYLWKTALQPILSYGNDCINLNRTDLLMMEKVQAKLVKASLGLSKYMRTTPLLHALNIKFLNNLNTAGSLRLFKSIMLNNSRSASFYCHLLRRRPDCHTLMSRVLTTCTANHLSISCLLTNDTYCNRSIRKLKAPLVNDGLVDSCRMLLVNYSAADKELLKLLLTPYF